MKAKGKFLAVLMAVTLLSLQALSVSATSFTRKFNGEAGIDGKDPGSSTYADGVVTLNLPDSGSLCWSYVPSATDLSFQFRVDTDTDPEFDWLGFNITNDGFGLLGEGTGLSTIFFRTGDGYCSRVVEADVMEWDAATAKELNNGSLYDDNNKPPKEDYAFGYGDWVTFSMKKNGSKWELKINGVDMVKNRYKGFDEDMTRLLGSGKITLTVFTSGVPGVVELKSYTEPADSSGNDKPSSQVTAPSSQAPTASTGENTNQTSSAQGNTTSTASTTDTSTAESGTSSVAEAPDASSETDQSDVELNTDNLSSSAEDENGGNGGLIAGIVIAVIVVLAAGSTAAYFIIKKRKQ